MKIRTATKAGFFLGVCLMATSSSAGPKLQSVSALAQALAAKLPTKPGILVYVAPPGWKEQGKGKVSHDVLCAKIGAELASALSAADPTAHVVTRPQAEAAMAEHGFLPIDAYMMGGGTFARLLGGWSGKEAVAITGNIREQANGFGLTEEAVEAKQPKPPAQFTALLPKTPQLQALYATPDVPIKNAAGTYLAGVGGVGMPTCILCANPDLSSRSSIVRSLYRQGSESITVALTVGISGRVSNVEIVGGKVGGATAGHGWRELVQATIRAVSAWRFKPAKGPDGKPVAVRLLASLRFWAPGQGAYY